jgi:hypothetical protein
VVAGFLAWPNHHLAVLAGQGRFVWQRRASPRKPGVAVSPRLVTTEFIAPRLFLSITIHPRSSSHITPIKVQYLIDSPKKKST